MSQSLEGATVLVTGGAGLIGSHIVDRLIDEGAGEIRVLDNLVRGRLENLAEAMARGRSPSSRGTSAIRERSREPSPAATTSSTRRRSASRSVPSGRGNASTCSSAARSTSSRRRSPRG